MASALAIKFIFVLISFVANILPARTQTGPKHSKIVVCYIQSWAAYRSGDGSYSVNNFDPNLCTHAIYTFAGLDLSNNTLKVIDSWQDLSANHGKGGYEKLTSLKNTYPHLKVSLAIGGSSRKSVDFSTIAATPQARRQQFAQKASEFLRRYGFDGLDIDWEYPTLRGGKPADKDNFVSFIRDLREQFKKDSLLLTSVIAASTDIISKAYEIRALSDLIDYFHVTTYDYTGSWDRKIGPTAPLRNEGTLSVENTIQFLLNAGASASKIVMGIPLFGRTFLTNAEVKYGSPSDAVGFQGLYTKERGYIGYNEICLLLSDKHSGWTTSWDSYTVQNMAQSFDVKLNKTKVISYDSTRSVANKVRFAIQYGLAGVCVWSIDTDDFRGRCNPELDTFVDFEGAPNNLERTGVQSNNFPLLNTINQAIILSLQDKQQPPTITHVSVQTKRTDSPSQVVDFYGYLSNFVDDVSCEPSNDYVVGCFISSSAVLRKNKGHFDVENIKSQLCTYLVIGHAELNMEKDDIKPLENWEYESDSRKETQFERLNVLKEAHPALKIILNVGGKEGSRNFSMLAANAARRERFARNVLRYLRRHDFDGLDLDWQYPTIGDGQPYDKRNLVELIRSLRAELDRLNLMLTLGVHSSRNVISKAYDLSALGNMVDYMHIHTFDYGGYWDEKITANAPLRGENSETVEKSIKHLLENGAPPSKIVLSLPFYGRSFITNAAGNYNDKSEGTFSSPWSNQYGALGYNEICYLFNNQTSGWSTAWDSETAQSIARHWDEQIGNTKVIVYDSTRSIAKKVRFAMENKLAGVLVWPLDTDDFRGECNLDLDIYKQFDNEQTFPNLLSKSRDYQLLKTVHHVIYSYRIIENNVQPCRHIKKPIILY